MSVLWAPKGGAALEVCFTSDDERLNPCTAAAGSPIPGHRGTVLCAAWSPACGKLFVSAGSDGIVIVWDASSGKAIRTLDGHLGRPVLAACFSPTGQLICSCDDGSAAEEPARLHHSQAHHASSSVNLTSANTGSLLQRLELPPSAQSGARGGFACAFSPAAGASCDAGGEQGVVLAVGCSEDQVVIFGQDPSSALVGGGLWRATSSLSGVHSGAVLSLAFSPSGRFLCSGGWDGVLGVWSVNTAARCIATVRAHSARVRCVAWSGDWIASASDDATVRVWGIPVAAAAAAASCDGGGGGVAAVTVLTSAAVLRGHFDWVRFVAFTADGKGLITASDDTTVRVWTTGPNGWAGSPTVVRRQILNTDGWARCWSGYGARSAALSPDGSCLVMGVWDSPFLRMYPVQWSPSTHRLASMRFREAAKALLLCFYRVCPAGLGTLARQTFVEGVLRLVAAQIGGCEFAGVSTRYLD